MSTRYSSPYPPPALLAEYNEIDPEFSKKIITTIDEYSRHRKEMDLRFYEEACRDRRESHERATRGQIFAFVVAITALIIAGLAAFVGAQWIGSVVGGAMIVGLVAAFLKGPPHTADEDDNDY